MVAESSKKKEQTGYLPERKIKRQRLDIHSDAQEQGHKTILSMADLTLQRKSKHQPQRVANSENYKTSKKVRLMEHMISNN